MASLADVFSEKERTNWLKAWLAVDITKSGLQHLAKTEAQNFHTSIYTSIFSHIRTPPGCTVCCTANLLICPTPKICKIWRNTCSVHDTVANYTRPCPVSICDNVRDQIANNHRYRKPSWKCTSAQRWASNPWEIAKCYFPEDGYDLKLSFEDTDFNGIISFLLNFKPIDQRFSFSIKQKPTDPPCLLTKARDICKAVRHTPVCKVTDIDLHGYFTTRTDLLRDPTSLAQDRSAQDAVLALQELKHDTLKITTAEMVNCLNEAQKTLQKVEQTAEEAIDEIKKYILTCTDFIKSQTDICKKEILDLKAQCYTEIATQTIISKKELHGQTYISKSEIVAQTDSCKQDVLSNTVTCKLEINSQKESCKQEIRVQSDTCKSEIEEKTNTCKEELNAHIIKCKSEIDNNASTAKEKLYEASGNDLQFIVGAECKPCNYETAREALKQQMKRYYSTRFQNTPLSVLMPLRDKPLMDIYVPPKMREHVDDQTKSVDNYRDILIRDAHSKYIFLKGEAGTGQTTFATKVVLDWCSDSSNLEPTSQRMGTFNDKQTLKEYEFVFLVTLRDSPTQLNVMHMIREQILDNIYGDLHREKMYELLQIVMQKETCLVIQDGLDEWSYSDGKQCQPALKDRKVSQPWLPTCYNQCTVLVTTRPWKLEKSISDCCIGSLLEITGIHNPDMLTNNILVRCQKEKNRDFNSEFKKYIDTNQLQHFLESPMMLTIIVCLWVDGICLKGTVCQIYSILLDNLLAKIIKESEHFHDSPVFCLKDTHFIKPNIKFVKSIAKVAFNCLFSFEREKSLVFSQIELYQYLQHLADKDETLTFALNAGILSQRRSSSFINRSPTLSFLHKSIQEFLAAYYIAENMNVIDGELREFVTRCENGHLQICELFRFLCGLNINAANKLSCVLYDHVEKLSTNQPHFCESRTFQKILIAGFKEAKANRHDESHIRLKLSHMYFDYSMSCTTDMEIATIIMKANTSNLRFWYIFGDANPEYWRIFYKEITYNSVQDNQRMYNAHKGKYELFDLSPCTSLESIYLSREVTLFPTALCNLHNLKHISIQYGVTVNGRLDLSASHSLETVDIGNIEVVFPTSLRGNMRSLRFTCKCDYLDLSLCHNLETIELSSGVKLNPNSISPQCKIKHLTIFGSCDGLNVPPDHNIDTLIISTNVRLLPVTLRTNLTNIRLKCKCSGLDLSLCNNLQELELGPEITLAPGALRGRMKHFDFKGTCSGLDLKLCHDLESIKLGDDVILIPGTSLRGNMEHISLLCMCSGLDLSLCDNLQEIELGPEITLVPSSFGQLYNLKTLMLLCTCDWLVLHGCHNLEHVYIGHNITLAPVALRERLKHVVVKGKCSGLDLKLCHNLESIVLGDDIVLTPGPLSGRVKLITLHCRCDGLDTQVCHDLKAITLGNNITLIPGPLPVQVHIIDLQCKCTGLDIYECHHLESVALGTEIILLPGRLPGRIKTIDLQCKCNGIDISECNFLESITLGTEIILLPGRLPDHVHTIDLQCYCTGLDISACHYIDSIALGQNITLLPVVLRGRVKKINLQCKCTRLDLSKCHHLESIALGKDITLRTSRQTETSVYLSD